MNIESAISTAAAAAMTALGLVLMTPHIGEVRAAIAPVTENNHPAPVHDSISFPEIPEEGHPMADASDPETESWALRQEKEIFELARNMFFEARDQGKHAKIAVGHVVMNRVKDPRFPNSVHDVVWQRRQFSWTHDGKSDDPMKYVQKSEVDRRAWVRCRLFAFNVYHGIIEDTTRGSMNYHSTKIDPPVWTKGLRRTAKVGNHVFYKGR